MNKPLGIVCSATSILLALALPVAVQAQDYQYTTNNGTITITRYPGSGGAVTIPNTLGGLPVTSIGERAFQHCTHLTRIIIPNSVTTIGDYAFYSCTNLTRITIPASVTSMGVVVFADCANLTGIYFLGNAPRISQYALCNPNQATVYYLPGTTGWGEDEEFGYCPTAMWMGEKPPATPCAVDVRDATIPQADGPVVVPAPAPAMPQMPGTNGCLIVICEPGIRLIVDGDYAGVTRCQTNIISLRPATNTVHRVILQKPDPVRRMPPYGYMPQSFTLTVEPAQPKEVVAAPFTKIWTGVPQFIRPADKEPPDRRYGQMFLSSHPEHCTVEFRSKTFPLPSTIGDVQIGDICEGTYGLIFHHNEATLRTNVTFRPHQSVILKADFVASRIRDIIAEREQYHQRIRDLIKEMRLKAFADFVSLMETEKDWVIGGLHEDQEWGQPDQKPICRDLLAAQGYSFANAIAWTTDAIDLAEKQGWNDLSPLIAAIYERPKNWWVYERAFRYLRTQAGKPVATNIAADAQILCAGSYYQMRVTDQQLSEAKQRLLKEPDKEAVFVYCLGQASTCGGKGFTDRGNLAAVDVLKHLDRVMVAQRIRQLLHGCEPSDRHRFQWVVDRLGLEHGSMKTSSDAEPPLMSPR